MSKNKATAARKKAELEKKKGLTKLTMIGGMIVIIFGLIFALQSLSDKKKLESNPYDTDDLHQATIDQLGDKHYQNIILPDTLTEKIESGEDVYAYFFSPTCMYCQTYTPLLMPIADDMGIHIDQLNLLEYDEWVNYQIEATPTLIHFKDGEEVNRLVGQETEANTRAFLEGLYTQP